MSFKGTCGKQNQLRVSPSTAGMQSFLCQLSIALLLPLLLYYAYFKLVASKYWKNRNVSHLEPRFLLGNSWIGFFSKGIGFVFEERYRTGKDQKLIGYWTFLTPSLLVTDLELVRRILVQDFNHFTDRPGRVNKRIDPLAGHLLNLEGSEWRNLRVKLTPTFTSGKMKTMFPILAECGLQLRKYLEKPADEEETIEVKEILARFTTDIISSCAFGIESNCLINPDSEFRKYGKKVFRSDFRFLGRLFLNSLCPRLTDVLRIPSISGDVSDFFLKIVKDTMEFREKNLVKRGDFMDLLIQLKNKGKLDDVDSEPQIQQTENKRFTLTEAAAQAFLFFAAGFETSSTTLVFAFYELALHPDVQASLQKEIDTCLRKTEDKITYDAIAEMEYLDWVVQETLRKHPTVPFFRRKCTKDYKIPELGVVVEKGTAVTVSVLGIHRDPEYFPDPLKFDPSRFSPGEKAKRDRMSFLPFGEGPRSCLGNRFGLLQTKVGLVSVLSEYDVEVSEKTEIPLLFNTKTFVLSPTSVHLKILKRKRKYNGKNT